MVFAIMEFRVFSPRRVKMKAISSAIMVRSEIPEIIALRLCGESRFL
jgi:hypothetical protein